MTRGSEHQWLFHLLHIKSETLPNQNTVKMNSTDGNGGSGQKRLKIVQGHQHQQDERQIGHRKEYRVPVAHQPGRKLVEFVPVLLEYMQQVAAAVQRMPEHDRNHDPGKAF
jgi:hypothetical protein